MFTEYPRPSPFPLSVLFLCRGKRAAVLMKRNSENSGVLIECPLHPVAMMGIDVDIHDSLTLIQEMAKDQHRIIDIAEPGGPVCQGVVQPSRDVEGNANFLVRNQTAH